MKKQQFVLCLKHENYEDSLQPWKIYPVLPDPKAQKLGMIRVIDDTEEDYLFPASLFSPIELPQTAIQTLLEERIG